MAAVVLELFPSRCAAGGRGCPARIRVLLRQRQRVQERPKGSGKVVPCCSRSQSFICPRFRPHRRISLGRTRRLYCRSGMDLQAKVRWSQRPPEGQGKGSKPAQSPLATSLHRQLDL